MSQTKPSQGRIGHDEQAGSLPVSEVQDEAAISPDGLTDAEVQQRRAQYGYNELPEKKVNLLLKFLSYFWGPIPWMIEAAVVLSAVVGHWSDFTIILILLVANAVVGFWEEFQAGNAIAALKATLALTAKVKRGGAWASIPARELVPGDLIRIRLGDIVPADAALLPGDPIDVDQSALTGESLPVTRKTKDTVYSGSIVRQGEVDAVVTGVGQNTYFGKTAHLVETAHTVSHFQRAVLKIGDFLIVIALALVILILTVALFRGDPLQEAAKGREPALLFALVLTGAAVADLLDLAGAGEVEPRFNIAPSQPVAVARLGDDGRELAPLRWGLVPSWARDAKFAPINARSETAADKPTFRQAMRKRRCLVPADGFFELKASGKRKQPFTFRLHDDKPFAFAGLWDRWEGPSGPVETCCILTTEANDLVRPAHDRMPVMLERPYFQ
jgi:putative SOS response-associated peptidase YedK